MVGASALMTGRVLVLTMVQRDQMASFEVRTAQRTYENVVERGVLRRVREYIPKGTGKIFVVTTEDVWRLHGATLEEQLAGHAHATLFFAGGEKNKRISHVETLAEQMMEQGADRTSLVIGFGGGIVTDISGFLAAIFMRGIPVMQIPTTLLAQVDAATGGKTGVNLAIGKNLVGSFHQPLVVLIDPEVLATLPEREYRAGLFEVVKCGVIRDRGLFDLLAERWQEVLAMKPEVVDELIAGAVRIKAEVVTADEREGDLRRILNFGHTIGHALEAETAYVRMLHADTLDAGAGARIWSTVKAYGPLPEVKDLNLDNLLGRLGSDKKTMQGKVHFVLPTEIGKVKVVSGIQPEMIRRAMVAAFS